MIGPQVWRVPRFPKKLNVTRTWPCPCPWPWTSSTCWPALRLVKIKALFLSLTKSDGKGFWRLRAYFWDTFLTHMCPNLAWGVEIFKSKTALILMPGLRIDPRHLVNNVCLYLDLTLSPSAQRNSTVARPITLICTETKKYWEGRKFWISLWRWTQNHRVGVWQGP